MLTLVALLIALACVAASARRLVFAITATALDPAILAASLRGDGGRALFDDLRAAVERVPEADWERAVAHATEKPRDERTALVNEQLMELDYRVARWARVPRVCASIATSSGFLLATLVLCRELTDSRDPVQGASEAAMHAAVTDAINVAAIGLAGAAFCIAIQFRARRVAAARAQATDKLVERLEALSAPAGEQRP
jgi:hypothetical protein